MIPYKAEVRQKYKAMARHLLVDEYQDINAAQHRLIQLLTASQTDGLFAVGDDAQSIYGFRGASPRFILEFTEHYPSAVTPPLPHSRRCHEGILRNAEKVLQQYYKDWTGPFELTFHRQLDDAPVAWRLPSEKTEAAIVSRIARESTAKGMRVLVLAPKKELFSEITRRLRIENIGHVCPISLLPNSTISRLDALSTVIQWAKRPDDNLLTRMTIEAIINGGVAKVPGANTKRKLKATTIEKRNSVEGEIARLWTKVSRAKSLYRVMQDSSLSSDSSKVREVMSQLLEEYGKPPKQSPTGFVQQAAKATGAWMEAKNFTDDIASIEDLIREKEVPADENVKLMTMRKAKGLEADVVIMVGLEDNIMPAPSADLEEEARIFYVSMTRAKQKLYLLHAFKRPRNISYGPELTNKVRTRFLDALGIRSEYKKVKP